MNRMSNFEFVSAPTTERAIELLGTERHRAKLLAGGTDLLDELKEGLVVPERLVNLKANTALRYIRYSDSDGLRIGALANLSDLEFHPQVMARYPALTDALRVLAGPQIRNMATVGGNLCQRPRCWFYRDAGIRCVRKGGAACYAMAGENTYHAILGGQDCFMVHPSDLAPVFIAYGARVTIAGASGRKTIALEAFFLGPAQDVTRENVLAQNEVLEEVSIPAPPAGSRAIFLKARERGAVDFATASVSAVLEMDGTRCRRARLVLGGVAPIPWSVPRVDELLSGAVLSETLARKAAEAAIRGAFPLSMNGYKILLARNLVKKAILAATERTV